MPKLNILLFGVKMKKFSAIIFCFLFLITCSLTGCAGFSVNKVKYYNEVVATVGNTNITRYDLLTAYNSYGNSYYVSQLGKSEEEAMEETLNILMDRESLYQYAYGKAEYKPSAYQINNAIQELFDNVDSSMDDYVKQAKRILNIKIVEDSADSNNETAYKYSDYDTNIVGKRAELKTENGVDYISYVKKADPAYKCVLGVNNEEALKDFESDNTIELIISTYFDNFYKSLKDEEKQDAIYNKAISLLSQDLISSERYLRDANGKAYNTVTKDLVKRYFKKSFDDKVKSLYLTNVRTQYLKNAKNELSINALVEKYIELVQTDYLKYANFESSYKSAMKDAGTKADEILYHRDLSDGTKFGYFIHCLIKFDDSDNNNQVQDLKTLELFKNAGMDDEEYRSNYNAIVLGRTKAQARDIETGLIDEDSKEYSLNEILDEYKQVTNLNQFITFMFRFSEDTATLSQGMPYVVGTNGNSAMETAFTDEAVRLMTEGKAGDMTPATTNTDSENGVTMCITSYGIHFLYFVGEVGDFDVPFSELETAYIASSNKDGNDNNLYYKELNPLTHQTYFDMLFDKVYPAASSSDTYASTNGYTARENEIIQETRKANPAKIYETKLKATKTSL